MTRLFTVTGHGQRFPFVRVDGATDSTVDALRRQLSSLTGLSGPLVVGGSPIGDSTRVADVRGLVHGAVLGIGAPPPSAAVPLDGLMVRVVAGPGSGQVVPLAGSPVVVGREPTCVVEIPDPSVAAQHLAFSIDQGRAVAHPLGGNSFSVNGSVLAQPCYVGPADEIQLGPARLRVVRPGDGELLDTTPQGDGRLRVNIPPPRRPPVRPAVIAFPGPVRDSTSGSSAMRTSIAVALITPALSIVAALVLRRPEFLVFALISPIAVIAQQSVRNSEERRRRQREATDHDAAAAAAHRELDSATRAEAAARHEVHPDLGLLALRAAGPYPGLWSRNTADDDASCVRLGLCDQPAHSVRVRRPHGEEAPLLQAVPLVVDLRAAGVLGIAGPGSTATALMGSVLGQLAIQRSPDDLRLVVIAAEDWMNPWEWTAFLPHVTDDRTGQVAVAMGSDSCSAVFDQLVGEMDRRRLNHAHGPWTGDEWIVAIDRVDTMAGDRRLAALLDSGPALGIHFVCTAALVERLPRACGAVVGLSPDGVATVTLPSGERVGGLVLDRPLPTWFDAVARSLAPLRPGTEDLGHQRTSNALPERVTLGEVLGAPFDDATLTRLWDHPEPQTRVPLGIGPSGLFELDISREAGASPHLLIGGTVGSGKSELLRTLVASLASLNPPDHVQFLLVDFRGEDGLGPCVPLPHVLDVLTNLDVHAARRILLSLRAEVMRRQQQVKAASQANDITAYWRRRATLQPELPPMPRLVVVLDEFAEVVDEIPDFIPELVRVGRTGGAYGIHLVLATQRPSSGVVSSDIKANITTRIALRTADGAASQEIIGTPGAADIPAGVRGRALVRVGEGHVVPVQTAYVSGPPASAGPRLQVVALDFADLHRPVTLQRVPVDGTREVDALVHAARTVAARRPRPPAPWLPALPFPLALEPLLAKVGGVPAARLVLGLSDDPEHLRQPVLTAGLDPGDIVLVSGGPQSGRTSALRTALAGILLGPTGATACYVVDGDSSGLVEEVAALGPVAAAI